MSYILKIVYIWATVTNEYVQLRGHHYWAKSDQIDNKR